MIATELTCIDFTSNIFKNKKAIPKRCLTT